MSKTFTSIASVVAVAAILIAAGIMISGRDQAPAPTTAPVSLSDEASLSLIAPVAGTIEVGDLQHVLWTAFNYGPATVSVNVIRKVSDNPARYELVRTVAAATSADGEAVWVPAATDIGANTFIEVGCSLSEQACRATEPTMALAVVDTGRFSNTASAYQAIEREENN